MQKEEFILIATRVFEGTATTTEKELFLFHINTFVQQNAEWETLSKVVQQKNQAEVRENIRKQIYDVDRIRQRPVSPLWRWCAGIAASLATIVFGVYLFNGIYNNSTTAQGQYDNDVAPGRNGATITTAIGKVIHLSGQKTGVAIGNELTYNDGTKVGEGMNTGITTLTARTAKGQTYRFTLSDGTEVWLDADSKISFPSHFTGIQRKVKLTGEAYFQVAKDKAHPFIVSTDKQTVEVLGTHFNINAYVDESSVKTTLLEGSVSVSPNQGDLKPILLIPGEQSSLGNNRIKVSKIDAELAVAWKNNQFIFENENIHYIMRMIARWYNVEIVYDGELPVNTFSGAVSRFENLSEVLKPLQATGEVKFKIEGRRVIVAK